MKRILLKGAGSMARIIHEMIDNGEVKDAVVQLVCDKFLSKPSYKTRAKFLPRVEVINKNLLSEITHFVICISGADGYERVKAANTLQKLGIKPISVLSRHSLVESSCQIGKGLQTMPGSIVRTFSKMGDQCIMNTNSILDHECIVGDGVHIMGGATVAGRVTIGDFTTVGTGATILPNLEIGAGAFIGAGAVVTKNVEPFSLVVGVPAQKIKTINKLTSRK